MPMVQLSTALILLVGSWSFTHPEIQHQPVVVAAVEESAEGSEQPGGVLARIENRSAKEVTEVTFVVAGRSCTSKPAWPAVTWTRSSTPGANGTLPERLEPGASILLHLSRNLLEEVASVSRHTCKEESPIELGVVQVQFADGRSWDIGTAQRNGEEWLP